MNYKYHYDLLINRARNRELIGYKERHHIIPRCLGGTDEKDNLVDLTPEEHYLAHLLLVKVYPNNSSLVYAAMMMHTSSKNICRNNKQYGWLKRKHQEICKNRTGILNSSYGSMWITNGFKSIKIAKEDCIPEGWKKGRIIKYRKFNCTICFIEIKKKIRYCNSCLKKKQSSNGIKNAKFFMGKGTEAYKNKFFITNGLVDRLHISNLDIPEGWKKGRSQNKRK